MVKVGRAEFRVLNLDLSDQTFVWVYAPTLERSLEPQGSMPPTG